MPVNNGNIIKRIQKLLSLSASDNEHEAAAAVAKVQALLSKYNLSMTDIPTSSPTALTAAETKARTRQKLEEWAYSLAGATANAFDCDYYHRGDGHTIFIGVGVDHEICAWTYTYLYRTLLRMGSTYLRTKCTRLRTPRSKKIARESYLRGIVQTIDQRLQEQKRQTPITETALVVVKDQAIAEATPGDVKEKHFQRRELDVTDMLRGMRDGRDIPLSTPLEDNQNVNLL